jgi:hypothetical protein
MHKQPDAATGGLSMRFLALLIVALGLLTGACECGYAQTPQPRTGGRSLADIAKSPSRINCYLAATNFTASGKIDTYYLYLDYTISPQERENFESQSNINTFIGLANPFYGACRHYAQDHFELSEIDIKIMSPSVNAQLLIQSKNGRWTIGDNTLASTLAAERRAAAEQHRRAEEAAAEQRRRAEETSARDQRKQNFDNQYKVDLWAAPNLVSANPFNYKDKLVAFMASFERMVGESEATFSAGGNKIAVRDVPMTEFKGDERVILVVKVIGLRSEPDGTKTADLTYVGNYRCQTTTCNEMQ